MNIADRWSLCNLLHRQNSAYILFCFFWKDMQNVSYGSNGVAKKKSKVLAKIFVIFVVLFLIALLVFFIFKAFSSSKKDIPSISKL